jgi:DNA-binding winged helix-turn-helix (wHTH) protein/CheY-like chemotaxis protein
MHTNAAEAPATGPFQVGDWIAHPALDELRRGATVCKLEPRTMRLLVVLAQRPGELVAVDELLEAVWKDAVVTSSSVYESVAQLRKALGDHADCPKYVATVQRKGYRLVAPVSPLPMPALAGALESPAPIEPAADPGGWDAIPASATAGTATHALRRIPAWGPALLALLVGLALVWHNRTPTNAVETADTPDTPAAENPTSRSATSSRQATEPHRVLWVDDTPSNNLREREALAALGVTFALAESTEAALQRLEASSYDLIISDMSRQGDPTAGYAFLKAVRDRGHTTRFVIYTTECDRAQMHEARSRGALGCASQVSELMQLSIAALETKQ